MTQLRVILDTNLLVSYLLTQGRTITRIIDYWENGGIVVLVSPTIVEELVEVVQRPRLRQQMIANPQTIIDLVLFDAVHTSGDLTLPGASRDPKDDKFLACAIEGGADYIVSGDEDLLVLGSFRGIPVIRAYDFVRLIESSHSNRE